MQGCKRLSLLWRNGGSIPLEDANGTQTTTYKVFEKVSLVGNDVSCANASKPCNFSETCSMPIAAFTVRFSELMTKILKDFS